MKIIIFILCFFFLYLFLVLPSIDKPLVMDEVMGARIAQQSVLYGHMFVEERTTNHPPLFQDLQRFSAYLFGLRGSNLRFLGIFCFLLNLILIFELSQAIFNDKKKGILASLIFALHPMAIQGSIIPDTDTMPLTVLLMLTFIYYVKNSDNLNFRSLIFLTLLLFTCLWAKISPLLLLMVPLILFHFLKQDKKGAIKLVVVSIVSVLILLLMRWIDLSNSLHYFPGLFSHAFTVIGKGTQGTSLSAIKELPLRILRVSLWIGLYPVLFWVVIICRRIKDVYFKKGSLNFNDLLIIYSIFLFIPYILVGGTLLSFAKYHYPFLPILSIIIANAVLSLDLRNSKKHLILCGLLGIVFLFIINIFCGDLLYQINYNLRKVAIFSPGLLPDFYKDFAKRLMFYFLPFIAGILLICSLMRKEVWIKIFNLLAITFILVNSLSISLHLRNQNYFTNYYYGRDIAEFKNIARLCKKIVQNDNAAKIIAPEDILAYAGVSIYVGYNTMTHDRDRFLKVIKDKRVQAVIYTFTYNAMYTYKEIFLNPLVQDELKKAYRLISFKEHSVWLRKK